MSQKTINHSSSFSVILYDFHKFHIKKIPSLNRLLSSKL